jgi:hypothetical protein
MQKLIIVFIAAVLTQSALACSCSEYPLAATEKKIELLRARISPDIEFELNPDGEQFTWIKAYPTLEDRLNLIGGMRDTSCHYRGPRGENLFWCSSKLKGDYEAQLRLSGKRCWARVRAVSTTKQVTVKLLGTDC